MEPIDRYRCVALAVLCYESATDEALGPPTAARRPHYAAHVDRVLGGLVDLTAADRALTTDVLMAIAPVFDSDLYLL